MRGEWIQRTSRKRTTRRIADRHGLGSTEREEMMASVTGNLATPREQSSSCADHALVLPPFRSAKDFPVIPKPEKLPALYPQCFQALQDANLARRMLSETMARRKEMIIQIRAEIERLESDLTVEGETRQRLHAMNEHMLDALRDIEQFTVEAAAIVEEAHRVPRTGLGRLIEKLKALVKAWRAFKRHQLAKDAPPQP